eukprot:5296045-Amphidinium_carterae.1
MLHVCRVSLSSLNHQKSASMFISNTTLGHVSCFLFFVLALLICCGQAWGNMFRSVCGGTQCHACGFKNNVIESYSALLLFVPKTCQVHTRPENDSPDVCVIKLEA